MSTVLERFRSRDLPTLERGLTGFPPGTLDAMLRFQRSPERGVLRELLPGFIGHHLPAGATPLSEPPSDGTRLVRDLGLDSLALAEMAFKMEDLFGFTVETREVADLETIGDLLAFLHAKLGLR